MSVSRDADLLSEIAKACDDHARAAADTDHVGGVVPRFVASPGSSAEVAQVLRVAAQHDLHTVVRGAGTKIGWGAAPTALELVVDTSRLAGVVEHASGDFVVIARAGTSVEDLQSRLRATSQELAFDNPLPGATVGGSLATSPSGPRRLLRGTLRDLLIGVTFVRADGVVAKAGGRVVKNVAGYDFGKLLTGSYGTLSLITEATFRLHPLPPRSHAMCLAAADAAGAAKAAHAVLSSQTVPSAVEIDWPADGSPTVWVLLEGTEDGVTERARVVADLLADGAHTSHTTRINDPETSDGATPPWWGTYPFAPDDVGLKLTCAITGLGDLLDTARSSAAQHGLTVALRGSAAGVIHAALPGSSPAGQVGAVVAALRARATSYDGSVVVLTAPPATRDALDLWGPVPGLTLMRRLKHELDPAHRLAPGRFVGGI